MMDASRRMYQLLFDRLCPYIKSYAVRHSLKRLLHTVCQVIISLYAALLFCLFYVLVSHSWMDSNTTGSSCR